MSKRIQRMEEARDKTIGLLLDRGASDATITRISIELNKEIVDVLREERRRESNGKENHRH